MQEGNISMSWDETKSKLSNLKRKFEQEIMENFKWLNNLFKFKLSKSSNCSKFWDEHCDQLYTWLGLVDPLLFNSIKYYWYSQSCHTPWSPIIKTNSFSGCWWQVAGCCTAASASAENGTGCGKLPAAQHQPHPSSAPIRHHQMRAAAAATSEAFPTSALSF